MSIQSNINQLFSLSAGLASINPAIQSRQEYLSKGRNLQSEQEAAVAGIRDIEKNLAKEGKQYSETELKDIEGRVAAHNRAIYDAKSAALNPRYQKIIDPQYIKQEDLRTSLTNIRSGISRQREQLSRDDVMSGLANRGMDKVNQNQSLQQHIDYVKKNYPGMYAIYGNRALEYIDKEADNGTKE